MKHKKILLYLFVMLLSFINSCINNSDKLLRSSQSSFDENTITELLILNKTSNNFVPKKLRITDPKSIKKLYGEMIKMELITHRVNVQSNMGFWDVQMAQNGVFKSEYDLHVVYTVYDGVVLQYNGKKYKNNMLESLVLGWFMDAAGNN